VLVTNTGIAPLYRDAFFAIGTTASTTSLRGLLPGEELWVEIAAPLTDSKDLHITSPHILSSQEIEYEADIKPTAVNTVKKEAEQSMAETYTLGGIRMTGKKIPANNFVGKKKNIIFVP
jgi:hypothetical protein